MAVNAQTIDEKARSHVLSIRWIISERDDLVWLIGSVSVSYLLMFVYVKGWLPLLPMMAVWAVGIDGPHVFGTLSRTWFDKTEWAKRRGMLLGSLLFFLVGPVAVLTGHALEFFFVAALWAYYHLVKQHYGFMVLYKKKNNDLERLDNILDRALLLLAFTSPFLTFIAVDPQALARVPVQLHGAFASISLAVFAVTIMVFVAWSSRQVQRFITGKTLNLPKYLLLAAAIPMHWIALLTPMPFKRIALVAILTVYHNIQYHRLIWFHNKKYSGDAAAREQFGPAAVISRSLPVFIGFALLFGLAYQGPRQYILGREMSSTTNGTMLVTSVLWGFAFMHYYLDSKIWRVRRDPSVGKALKMS